MSCNIGRVANALLGDYTSVYCIDPKTGYYECYSTNPEYKKLELQSSGEDFFADARRDIAAVVFEEDRAEVFSVAVCDLNGLKEINDTRGRQAGDECTVAACRMICDIFQHSLVFRIGGDEFAAVLKGRDYVIRKELILALHDRSVEHIGTESPVISAGYSDYIPGEDAGFQAVLERAEAQMYEEKKLLKGMGEETREDGGEMSLAAEKARGFRTRRMRNDMTDNGRSGPAWNCTAIGA